MAVLDRLGWIVKWCMCMCLQALGMHESKQCTVVEAFYLGKQWLLEKQTLWDNADLCARRLASTCFSKALFFPVSMFSLMMSIAVLSSKQILASMRFWHFFSLDVCGTGVLVILHFFYFVQAYVKVALTTCNPFVLQPRARRRLRGFVFFWKLSWSYFFLGMQIWARYRFR